MPPLSDDVQLSIEEYRNKLYEVSIVIYILIQRRLYVAITTSILYVIMKTSRLEVAMTTSRLYVAIISCKLYVAITAKLQQEVVPHTTDPLQTSYDVRPLADII